MRKVHAGTDLNVLPVIPLIQLHDLVRNIKLIHRLLGLRTPQHITLCLLHENTERNSGLTLLGKARGMLRRGDDLPLTFEQKGQADLEKTMALLLLICAHLSTITLLLKASKLDKRMRHLWIFSWTIVSRSPAFMDNGATEGRRPPRSDVTREPTCSFPHST